jgi:hypothetical protein
MIAQAKTVRMLFVIALAIYLGGFTFYSLAVIPILHERLASAFEAGLITQEVTNALNGLGVITLSLGWLACWAEGRSLPHDGRGRVWQWSALAVSSICLVALFVLHGVLDRKLESGTGLGFYRWHRAYLWASTIQWIANLGLLVHSAK